MADDFIQLSDPFRRELLAHCYRMLGSVHDAEDLVQETYLRAWKAYDRFEGRSSLRTWLYRIATTACLTAIEKRARRPLPTGLGADSDPADDLVDGSEVPWLEPLPDEAVGADPASIVTERETIRLAFVASLQYLPPRQRAVLILRDVLRWSAKEVAELLETSTPAVNSILQRARAQLAEVTEESVVEPSDHEQRELLDRYVTAFEAKDIPAIVGLFTPDVVWEMPPFKSWYRGPDAVATHLGIRCSGGIRMVATRANGQAAFGLYLGGEPFNLQVLTVGEKGISHVVNFLDASLFEVFGLPASATP
ncbi:sigma-70 family RNA polymerase sigma factor [Umezawaea sp. Da 62-37]|uniref:sigma-70 family RNA polymerase sigma factor n=1 Tax=Umezawaea sp. Da 62-37 TaxID=3075927 RepID=UPI0028F73DF3|nr:sigma-70 family RNA polymerase sigma factor [Umezawaea sp. Da 62-37]WNV90573.1 sigma-70 family RNA polymerase sigma factor [Umezawaea sp. Da 62-37]